MSNTMLGFEIVDEPNASEAEQQGCELLDEVKGEAEKNKGQGEAEKHEPASLSDVVLELQGLRRELKQHTYLTKCCCTKLTLIELRQSTTQGEGTDAVRAADQWAKGESALLSLKSVEVISKSIQANPKNMVGQGTYTSIFFNKDLRRGWSVVIEMYMSIVRKEYKFFGSGSEYEQGWLLQFMPEFREALE